MTMRPWRSAKCAGMTLRPSAAAQESAEAVDHEGDDPERGLRTPIEKARREDDRRRQRGRRHQAQDGADEVAVALRGDRVELEQAHGEVRDAEQHAVVVERLRHGEGDDEHRGIECRCSRRCRSRRRNGSRRTWFRSRSRPARSSYVPASPETASTSSGRRVRHRRGRTAHGRPPSGLLRRDRAAPRRAAHSDRQGDRRLTALRPPPRGLPGGRHRPFGGAGGRRGGRRREARAPNRWVTTAEGPQDVAPLRYSRRCWTASRSRCSCRSRGTCSTCLRGSCGRRSGCTRLRLPSC